MSFPKTRQALPGETSDYRGRGLRESIQADDLAIFIFETDFVGTMRCVPMAVRFKLDQCGIKLSLRQWNCLSYERRLHLFHDPCTTTAEIDQYRARLVSWIRITTGEIAKEIVIERDPAWAHRSSIPDDIVRHAKAQSLPAPTLRQWAALSPLQRFALLKLTRPGHDNINFTPALREFGLLLSDETSK